MKFLRNPEVTHSLLIYLAMDSLLFIAGFLLYGVKTGMVILLMGMLYTVLHFADIYRRYGCMEKLSEELEGILYGRESSISSYQEGELAILQSQIGKLLVRLREQADRLQADKTYLADSLADISHQIRTPLTSINLIVNFLKEPELSEERRKQLLFDLTKQLERIEWQICTLLKRSKMDAGTAYFKQEEINLKKLVKKAADAIAIPMELRQQQFSLQAEGTEFFVGDENWTYEAFSNILKNCMEHTPVGGWISVTILDNVLYSQLVIEDTGKGMSPEDLNHIFDRFYKGKDSARESVGIGLALAKMIVTKQNGTIKAENRKEGGARFIIRFYKKETI